MPEFFSSDGSLPLQFLVIFGAILLVMMAAYALFRRFFDRGAAAPVRMGSRGRQPRLGIVDIYELDQRRQLILLRRDNVEHLLLVGGPNDVVVERNVQRIAGSRLPADAMIRPEPASDMPFLPGQDEREEGPSLGPSLAPPSTMPVTMPPPLPEPEEALGPRFEPPLFEPRLDAEDKAPRPEPAARRERTHPPRREAPPIEEPWREAAAERAASAAPIVPEPAAPVAAARPAGRSAISSMARQFENVLRKQAAPPAPPAKEPAGKAEPPPPVVPPAEPTPAPASEPTPEPVAEPTLPRVTESPVLIRPDGAPAEPAPPATDPVAAGMSSAPDPMPEPKSEPAARPVRPAAPTRPTPQPAAPARPIVQPVARIRERPAERLVERPLERPLERPREQPVEQVSERSLERPEPNVVSVKQARPAPSPPPEEQPAPEPRRGANPFSVEEIEAEFARLLGRPLSRRD